jgi:beta-mannosidase
VSTYRALHDGWTRHGRSAYRTTFPATPAEGRTDLVCAGLDTVARIVLNDVEIARAGNGHSHRFDVGPVLRAENTLQVEFESAHPYGGIRPDIGLHTWSVARIDEVCPLATVDGRAGRMDVHVVLERESDGPVMVVAAVADCEAVARVSGCEAVLTLPVSALARCDLDVTLSDSYGLLDVWSRRVEAQYEPGWMISSPSSTGSSKRA